MKKRILQFGMTSKAVMIALLIGVAGMMEGYSQSFISGNFMYSIISATEKNVKVIGPFNLSSEVIQIPSTVDFENNTYTVTVIGNNSFRNYSGFTDLILPNTIETIQSYAFNNCTGLASIMLPESIVEIGVEAFTGTRWYNNQSDGIVYLDNCCLGYKGISPTGELVLNEGTRIIGERAFSNCGNLTGMLTIPSTVTSIGSSAFMNCTGFSGTLLMPTSLRFIGSGAFYGCSGFSGSLIIPNSVYYIGGAAFYGCIGLSGSLVIPNTIELIDQYTFYGCSGITELTIGESVSSIGEYAFWNCSNLVTVHFNATNCNTMYTVYNSVYLSVFGLTPSIVELTIGTNVQTIPNYAFKRCMNITGQLIIPNSVVTIGESAFSVCSGLSGNLLIPNSVVSIGCSAFSYCSGFSGDLIIPNSVTSLGNSAFLQCSGFTGFLNIGNSLTSIGSETFSNCSGFTSVNISNSVNEIGDFAFYNCMGINEISIPNTVSSIGIEAFAQTGWYNSHINGVLYLDDWCLGYKGEGINLVQIQDGIKHIANGAFMMDSDLTSISIPNSVTTIGNNAFANCENLSSVDLGNSLITIENHTFSLCSNLHSISLPNSLVSIGDYAFWQSGLQSIVIPNSVNYIGADAFELCEMMRSVTLGSSVIEIGDYAFGSCWSLNSIISLSHNAPLNGDEVFMNISKSVPVCVPYSSVNTYLATFGWSDFTNYQEIVYRTITGYSNEESHWSFIASPLAENTAPTEIDDMILTTGTYDLYRFDQTENAEWQNYKANSFNLANGQGYLYANAEDVNLIFKGEFNEDETKNVGLVYDANAYFAGWNLVGNPFPVSAYANKSYYTMNEDGSAIEPVAVSMETDIPSCTGVMVKAENTGESVTFSKTAPETAVNQGVLQIVLSQLNPEPVEGSKGGVSTGSTTALDKAIVSFNAGDALEKFVFNKDNAKLYIPQSDKDLAIACAKKEGELPLNFKASKNGKYTITVNPEAVEMDYLHLIDNMTGNDIDLLASPSYSFNAQTTDYASRFRLVFSVCGDADGDNGNFAFISNDDIIINGEGTVQVIDMTGHIIISLDGRTRYISTTGMTSGVYILRLIDWDDVKTQKIVVR